MSYLYRLTITNLIAESFTNFCFYQPDTDYYDSHTDSDVLLWCLLPSFLAINPRPPTLDHHPNSHLSVFFVWFRKTTCSTGWSQGPSSFAPQNLCLGGPVSSYELLDSKCVDIIQQVLLARTSVFLCKPLNFVVQLSF